MLIKNRAFFVRFFLMIGGILFSFFIIECRADDVDFPPVQICGNKIYAGDEELFLNAVGYSGIRPGKDQFDPIRDEEYGYDLIELDMRRIKETGFNAIRTYALLDEKLVELAAKYGLWVVAGIWTDPNLSPHNDTQTEKALDIVKEQAKIYSKYPNVAMLLLINEPDPGRIYNPATKRYMKLLAETAKNVCPDVPVSFANMPNSVFVDPSPWDVISQNIYAAGFNKFQESIGYRGFVEGVRKLCSGNKPFFVSEFGFYTPVPKPNPKEPWFFYYVKNEEDQAKSLLKDQDILSRLGLSGMTLMTWHDDWRNFNDVPAAQPFLKDPKRTKYLHDMFTQEWSGLIAFDEDIKGKPRLAYHEVSKVNQAILLEPDPEAIYGGKVVPVRIYLTDAVKRLSFYVDGKGAGEIPRVSKHWAEILIPAPVLGKKDSELMKRHAYHINVYDKENRIIRIINGVFWTGVKDIVPSIKIREPVRGLPMHTFIIELKDYLGNPISGAKVRWGLFDVFNWTDYGGVVTTGAEGTATFSAPKQGRYLVGAGYEFSYVGFTKRCTDLIFAQ